MFQAGKLVYTVTVSSFTTAVMFSLPVRENTLMQ